MKNKMKFAALFMMLLVTAPVFAQKVDQMKRAQNTIDNLCQTVNLDATTKQKAIDLTYEHNVAYSDRDARMKANELTEKEFNAIGGKIYDNYWKELQALIPEDQLDAFLAWKSKPKSERNAVPKKK